VREPGKRRWQCNVCSDIYDEALGLPEYGIEPGTRFEDLPDDWGCPMCGAPGSDFRPLAD
jgi:rubredoxin